MKLLNSLMVAALLFSLSACINQPQQGQAEADSLRMELRTKQKEMDELLATINIVQEGFNQIDEAEGRIDLVVSHEGVRSDTMKIEEQMNFIIRKMSENREKIEELTKKLSESNYVSNQTKKTVELLTKQLAEKEASLVELREVLGAKNIKIAELDDLVASMSERVAALEDENALQGQVLDLQDKIINQAWYVFGTKRELRDRKILSDGEVLQNDSFDKSYFTEVDIRDFTELPLYSKRAKIETTHPANTYQLAKDSKGQYVLKITDPVKFWEVSRYLVIVVK